MNKSFSLLFVLILTNHTLHAQTQKIEYEKAVDYCASKIAYAYTKQYIENGCPKKYKKESFEKEKKLFNEVIKIQLEETLFANTMEFNKLSKLLIANEFSGFNNKITPVIKTTKASFSPEFNREQAKNRILEGFFSDPNFILIVNKYSAIQNLNKELRTDLSRNLESFKLKSKEGEEEEDPVLKKISRLEEEIEELKESIEIINAESDNSIFPNWLIFSLIIILSILLFQIGSTTKKKLKKSLVRHREEIDILKEAKGHPINPETQNNNSQFEKTVNQNINELNQAIERLQKENFENSISQIQQKNQSKQHVKKEVQNAFYVNPPISEKVFSASDVSEDKDGKFYKLILTSDNQAKFEFFNSENSAKRAINAPDSFLYTACEELESLNQNATRIITKKSGTAIKQDDKWIIKEKAQIIYE